MALADKLSVAPGAISTYVGATSKRLDTASNRFVAITNRLDTASNRLDTASNRFDTTANRFVATTKRFDTTTNRFVATTNRFVATTNRFVTASWCVKTALKRSRAASVRYGTHANRVVARTSHKDFQRKSIATLGPFTDRPIVLVPRVFRGVIQGSAARTPLANQEKRRAHWRRAMGTNIPASRTASIDWVADRVALWGANAAAIGLTAIEVGALTTLAATAGGAQTDAQIARDDARSATLKFHTDTDAMRASAADLVATIKAFAEKTNDPNVYVLANVSPADPHAPLPLPSQPTNGTAELGGNGAITLNFDAIGPGGTVWQVWRRLDAETQYAFVGNADSRTKSFLDATIPAGTARAQYTIQGVRGRVAGPVSFAITVQFGSAAAGAGAMGAAA
jgi:hypothetical protein